MDFAKLCPGCMRELKNKHNSKCPHCGFDAAAYKQNTRCLPINTILTGKYLIGKVLGEGGFGITYIGFDLNMEVPVAIKEYFPVELVSRDTTTMHGDRVLSMSGEKSVTYKEGLKKYVAEAQNVSKFSAMPGVVSVKDFFYENDTAYIVMEYIDGISLKDYLKQKNGKLTEPETLRLIQPVLEALEQIHASGIVHRDISPDNIMLTFKADNTVDSVKLIDFGAARMTAKNDQHSLTIILKHGYAPEEQYRTHGEQGPWTDVYAICATMYRMLTGVTPEPAMDRIFQDKLKRPSELGVGVSKAVEEALMEGLAVKKEDRIASIAELKSALQGGKKRRSSASAKRAQTLWVGIGAAAVLAVAGGIFFTKMLLMEPGGVGETGRVETNAEAAEKTAETASNLESEDKVILAEAEEEVLGEQIVFSCPQTDVSSSGSNVILRYPDGTVFVGGESEYGQKETANWTHVAAVAAAEDLVIGLREDGTVYAAGYNRAGRVDELIRWTDIVSVASPGWSVFGLRKDGTIIGVMDEYELEYGMDAVYEWKDIKAIAGYGRALAGLDVSGKVWFAGAQYNDETAPFPEITDWTDVEHLIMDPYALYGLTRDGKVRGVSLDGETYADLEEAVKWENISQLTADVTVVGTRLDGTVCHTGEAEHRYRFNSAVLEAALWEDMVCVEDFQGKGDRIFGITRDGTLKTAIANYGSHKLEEMENLKEVYVRNFDRDACVYGVTQDGEVLTYGRRHSFPNPEAVSKLAEPVDQGDKGLLLLRDGTVASVYFEHPLTELTGIEQAAAGNGFYAALLQNGSVVGGEAEAGNAYEIGDVSGWTDIVELTASMHYLAGLRSDGTVILNSYKGKNQILEGWDQIKHLYSGYFTIGGVCEDGSVRILDDRANAYNQEQAENWTDIEQLAFSKTHSVGLKKDGTVTAIGNNSAGQCEVEEWKDIIFIAAGDNCTLGVQKDGRLIMAGSVDY